jgi:hypothetical protein
MPISLSKLSHGLATVTVEYDGDTVNVTYATGKVTPHYGASLEGRQIAEALPEIVTAWDVLGDDGQPLPCSIDVTRQLPVKFTNAVMAAIQEDQRPNGRRAAT